MPCGRSALLLVAWLATASALSVGCCTVRSACLRSVSPIRAHQLRLLADESTEAAPPAARKAAGKKKAKKAKKADEQAAPEVAAEAAVEAAAEKEAAAAAKVEALEQAAAEEVAAEQAAAAVLSGELDASAPEYVGVKEEEELSLPSWFDDAASAEGDELPGPMTLEGPGSLDPVLDEEPEAEPLTMKDLINTKWVIEATPREDSWLKGGARMQEFTLLDDSNVVWGGSAGGFGTGGRWALKDGIIEVIRSTPLGLLTGRDYYMASAVVKVDDKLQFQLDGVIRSYNAVFPVQVIADFQATRLPGRFVMTRNDEEDEEDDA